MTAPILEAVREALDHLRAAADTSTVVQRSAGVALAIQALEGAVASAESPLADPATDPGVSNETDTFMSPAEWWMTRTARVSLVNRVGNHIWDRLSASQCDEAVRIAHERGQDAAVAHLAHAGGKA